MKNLFSTAASVAALVNSAAAYATLNPEIFTGASADPDAEWKRFEKRQAFGINVKFDPKTQYVSNQGKYKFVAPQKGDIRGPCPGLNAMANHGYIPHNGVATIDQFIKGTYDVFGMAVDLAGFLSVYGAVFDGDLLSWSIGGPAPSALIPLTGGLLSTPQGLSGSHNKYEGDASPTRGDLYTQGDNYKVVLDQFKEMYAMQDGETEESSNYDLGVLTNLRVHRFNSSINTNPYFFNNFFSGLEVQPAAYTFIYRFMSNKSHEFPEGRLSKNVLKSFFAVYGDTPDEFVYKEGWERIPDNWYKRALGDEYSIPFFEADLLAAAVQFPQFLDVGGNLGKVGTFTPLNLQNITGGLYNAQLLLQPKYLQCFVYEMIFEQGPDLILGTFLDTLGAINKLKGPAAKLIGGFACPKLNSKIVNQYNSELSKYPGYSKMTKKGTY